jgi:hypothetical protein
MSMLLLVLALVAPAPSGASEHRSDDRVTCSVDVRALDGQGHARPARRVSAGVVPAVVFRGQLSAREDRDDDTPPATLLFDVFNPRGQLYQVLVATPHSVVHERGRHRVERASRVKEATLPVAGSSIAWTSMYGRWRVEPRIEGTQTACGRPEYFTIRP